MSSRRDFLKKITAAGIAAAAAPIITKGENIRVINEPTTPQKPVKGGTPGSLIVPKKAGLPITGTFLDEISHDIPHQNWGIKEWDQDFRYMKSIGIDTVIDIRSGYRKFLTYPSPYLLKKGCYMPSVDLIEMFCTLADKYNMKFYFGLYDSGHYWDTGDMSQELEDNKYVIEEAWQRYGHHKSFKGWYISTEISRQTKGAVNTFHTMVDCCAFQDGHIDYDELDAFFSVNKKLADRYGMQCWTNAETFDRDMPIHFLPIKFDKLRMKLEAAKRCGYDKAITFEFSHFLSPQSAYFQAHHLYDRYCEYFEITPANR